MGPGDGEVSGVVEPSRIQVHVHLLFSVNRADGTLQSPVYVQ
jgi:hypothetical protein